MSNLSIENLSLSILQARKPVSILKNVTLEIPTKTMALIGASRLEVMAVMDLFCRRLVPQTGAVHFDGAVSWPIGRPGPFFITVTGTQAISHFSVIYGFDRYQALAFMHAEFAAPKLLTLPISTWPKTFQTQFTMLMALVPPFDVYLVDTNIIMPDDVTFSERFLKLFNGRTQGKTVLITARQTKVIHALCDGAIVVADCKIYEQPDLKAALMMSNKVTYDAAYEAEKDTFDDDVLF